MMIETIKVISILSAPFIMEKRGADSLKGIDRYEGFNVDLANALMEATNNTLKFNLEIWHSYSSAIDLILNGSADLLLADFSILAERSKKGIEFSMPFMTVGHTLMGRKAETLKENGFYFLNPVSPEVWLSVGISYLAVSILLYIIARLSPSEQIYPENETKLTFLNSFWFSLAALVGQGSEVIPRSFSSRILVACWWGFILIIVNSYTANLAAFQTVARLDIPIGSLKDLVNQNAVDFDCKKNGGVEAYLKSSKNPLQRQVYNQIQQRQNRMSRNSELIEKVRRGGFIFISGSALVKYTIQDDCSLEQIGEVFNTNNYGLVFRPDFKYKQVMNTAILGRKLITIFKDHNKTNCNCVNTF
ncbi:glutamate receptor ionotropic, kainate 2 [Eurytemora carolleeae]|uniref:glutamate receptor ionotropic, kainate 2 n=1 Tax=Eurytemora carolleeae TaxID=1294199 RepID=UPI000C757B69|nr:glutamate receptor ionotropic, kainate 2 [Eurytemora carolleeae]|eukprot:XP_023323618.1 glutamate receptor ionotropic, kainate 2-like [Eurytemora affinis]